MPAADHVHFSIQMKSKTLRHKFRVELLNHSINHSKKKSSGRDNKWNFHDLDMIFRTVWAG